MTIRIEINLTKYRKIRSNNQMKPNVLYLVITRSNYQSVLSPSWNLLKQYKKGNMSWKQYRKAFIKEIRENPKAVKKIKELREISKEKDIYLICYESDTSQCHRSIVKELIESGKI